MHMPDGVLPPAIWGAMDVAAIGVVGYAAHKTQKRLDPKDVPLMGVMTAFIFAGQMVNFPVAAGVSGHLVGATLAAVLLGFAPAMLVMTTVLIIQCFLYADGGVAALGVNIVNMAVIAPAVGYGVYRLLSRSSKSLATHSAAVFVASWLAVVASAGAVCLQLLPGYPFMAVVPPAMGWHALIGIGEGLVTVAALQLVWKTRPDLVPARGGAPA